MRRLFGTDGIRGVAGEFPLDDATVRSIGRALGRRLVAQQTAAQPAKPTVVLGQDTRESSTWIADALSAALAGVGVEARSAGVIPTPGVAYVARKHGFTAGVVVSASHNPWTDNGIKVFGGDGYKLADAVELEIEREIFAELAAGKEQASSGAPAEPSLPGDAALRATYVEWLISVVAGQDLSGLHVMADCANGAAAAVAGEVLQRAGVKYNLSHNHPSGKNINEKCGALFPETVAKEVVQRGANLGVSFDGDADRCLLADANGKVVNGDGILLLAAREMKQRGKLKNNTVVATTMSNMGLEVALEREGIKMLRAPVGDKYVLEEMQKPGAGAGTNLGGEQSGHIIFLDHATTGDGLLTALMVLSAVARSGKPLHELVGDLKVFPQTIKNVRVREKQPLEQVPEIAETIAAAKKALDGNGRVVVRYSGTEALCRVMVEAESDALMEKHADAIAAAVMKTLG